MRVLIIAYYFPPLAGGGVNRTLALVRGMTDAGLEPVVLTVDDAAWDRDPALLGELSAGLRILRLPNPDWGRVGSWRERGPSERAGRVTATTGGRLRGWLVPDLCVGWSALAAASAGAFAGTGAVDLVYTTSPPYSASWAGRLSRALGVPWVADFRDAWTDCPTRGWLPPWRARLERALERSVFRNADRVLFASEGARLRALRREPRLAAHSETILTGYDPRAFAPVSDVVSAGNHFEIVHAGSINPTQRPYLERFLAGLEAWSATDPRVCKRVRVRFVGLGPDVAQSLARPALTHWVAAESRVGRRELTRLLRGAQLCLAFGSDAPCGGDPIPGKVFDAAGAGTPLLALVQPGALQRVVSEHALGSAVDPRASERLRSALAEPFDAFVDAGESRGPAREPAASLENGHAVRRILQVLREVRWGDLERHDSEREACRYPSVS